jgi:hypothetical protein
MNASCLRTVAGVATVALAATTAPAAGKITPYPREYSADPLARAIVRKPNLLRQSVFAILPPEATPAAVSTTKLADFPRNGKSFGILSTGNARIAPRKNTKPDSGSQSKGLAVRGARDVVIARIGFFVPRKHDCLTFNFRFLSEEFPEYVDDIYNDTFVRAHRRCASQLRDRQPRQPDPHQLGGGHHDVGRAGAGHHVRRRHATASRVGPGDAWAPPAVPVDVRPG